MKWLVIGDRLDAARSSLIRTSGVRSAIIWVLMHEVAAALVLIVTFGPGVFGPTTEASPGATGLSAALWFGEWALLTAVAQALFLGFRFPGVRLVSWVGATVAGDLVAVPAGLCIGVLGFISAAAFVSLTKAAANPTELSTALGIFTVLFTLVTSTVVPGMIIGGCQALVLMDRAPLRSWAWIRASGVGGMLWFWPTLMGLHHYDTSSLSAPVQAAAGLLLGTGLYAITTGISLSTGRAQSPSVPLRADPDTSSDSDHSTTS